MLIFSGMDFQINVKEDWKLVNIFIGANDICVFCTDHYINSTVDTFFIKSIKKKPIQAPHGNVTFMNNIIKAVQILKDNLPRHLFLSINSDFSFLGQSFL